MKIIIGRRTNKNNRKEIRTNERAPNMLDPNNIDLDLSSYFEDESDNTNGGEEDSVAVTEHSDDVGIDNFEDVEIEKSSGLGLDDITQSDERIVFDDNASPVEQLVKLELENLCLPDFISYLQNDELTKHHILNIDIHKEFKNLRNSTPELDTATISNKRTPVLVRRNSGDKAPVYILANMYSENTFPVIKNYHSGIVRFDVLVDKGILYEQFYGGCLGICCYVPFDRSRKITAFYQESGKTDTLEPVRYFMKSVVNRSDFPVLKDRLCVLKEYRDPQSEIIGSDLVSATQYRKFEKKVKNMKTIQDYVIGLNEVYSTIKNPNQFRSILDIFENVLFL